MKAAVTAVRRAGSELASCARSSERRRAAVAPGPAASPAARLSAAAPLRSAAILSSSFGAGRALRFKAVPSACAVFRMRGSLRSWSAGTKLSIVRVCSTSGSAASRLATAAAASGEGSEHLRRIRADPRVLDDVAQGGDRFRALISQVQWIEIELQLEQRRRFRAGRSPRSPR